MKFGLIISTLAVLTLSVFSCAQTDSERRAVEGFVLHKEDELAQFKKIQIGMAVDEVDAILGSPKLASNERRYYGHTPRIRPIDSPYSAYSIIISIEDGKVQHKEYVPDKY